MSPADMEYVREPSEMKKVMASSTFDGVWKEAERIESGGSQALESWVMRVCDQKPNEWRGQKRWREDEEGVHGRCLLWVHYQQGIFLQDWHK